MSDAEEINSAAWRKRALAAERQLEAEKGARRQVMSERTEMAESREFWIVQSGKADQRAEKAERDLAELRARYDADKERGHKYRDKIQRQLAEAREALDFFRDPECRHLEDQAPAKGKA